MGQDNRSFDEAAATWDENPARVRLARDVVEAMAQEVDLEGCRECLDFGCGTGLVTLGLALRAGFVTGVDSSPGMIDVLGKKLAAQGIRNVKAVLLDVEKGDELTGSYDLVASSMTLHHVRDLPGLLGKLFRVMAPGGRLCIADLDLEGGRFHEDGQGVFHNGFDRAALRRLMTEAGLEEVKDWTAAEVMKPVAGGGMAAFTVFLMTGRKKES